MENAATKKRSQCWRKCLTKRKLEEGRFRLGIRNKFFNVRVVRLWNRLSRGAVIACTLEAFQARLDGAVRTWSIGRCPCL